MSKILNIPHRTRHGMCPVNGIRDLVQWRSARDWSNEFLWGLGQGGGFAYLRFNAADPPRQVYTGISTPRLTPLLPFLGIALIGHSAPYAVLSALFIILHTWHGIQNLTL